MDLLNYCRFCLADENILIDSSCKDSNNLTYLEKIQEIFPPLLTYNSDIFPSGICTKCCEKINQFYQFIQISLNSQQTLMQYNFQLQSKSDKKTNFNDFISNLSNNDLENNKNPSNLEFNTSGLLNSESFESGSNVAFREKPSNENVKKFYDKKPTTSKSNTKAGKLYKCRLCNKTLLNIRRHILTVHTGIKAFNCKICSKNFTSRESLKYHESVVHLNIRNFECNICKKRYGLEKFLRKHMEGHEKAKNRLGLGKSVNTAENIKIDIEDCKLE